MSGDCVKTVLKFSPFSSHLEVGFWHKYAELKLDDIGLGEEAIPLWGTYSSNSSLFTLPHDAFNVNKRLSPSFGSLHVEGRMIQKNTLDSFRSCDKNSILQEEGNSMWSDITSGKAYNEPQTIMGRFIMVTYADLKHHHFYYWFAFPSPLFPELTLSHPPISIKEFFPTHNLRTLLSTIQVCECLKQTGCCVLRTGECVELSQVTKWTTDMALIIVDPSTLKENPGWPLRNLIALITTRYMELDSISVICLRGNYLAINNGSLDESIVLSVNLPQVPSPLHFVGWERNQSARLGPRMTDLSSTMDASKMAETCVDLNLKLMKWRMLPELDLKLLHNTKCLLLGAGTLGCAVARCLLGWGFRHITLVDNGKVAPSNPVRQSLFSFEDAVQHRGKAEAAADALKSIFPAVVSRGLDLCIPMPGHPVGESLEEETRKAICQLDEEIELHDAVFLLLDTREARWLPTVLGAANEKIVINAALGFDTYLIIRHGPVSNDLGCYFCSDVVAPGNSTRDRTMDQQCTVTRPGVSMIASALATELLVSILMHPLKNNASTEDDSCPLGIVPHSIRGFLSTHTQIVLNCQAFTKCTACSQTILDHWQEHGVDFVMKVLNSPRHLEDITGLTELHQEVDQAEVLVLSDEDSG